MEIAAASGRAPALIGHAGTETCRRGGGGNC